MKAKGEGEGEERIFITETQKHKVSAHYTTNYKCPPQPGSSAKPVIDMLDIAFRRGGRLDSLISQRQ